MAGMEGVGQPTVPQTIAKKRQSCACDFCRKAKKKCDGASPCARCVARKKLCTYSPFSRKKKLKKPDPSALVSTSYSEQKQLTNLETTFLSTQYVDSYINRINPTARFMGLSTRIFENVNSKPELLQYNAMLASAARFNGDKSLYTSFEKRASQLASELMEDFTEQTAIGYYLFAFHLWGENDTRACHYRDITRSLCRRIERNNTGRKPNGDLMFMLQLGTVAITELGSIPAGAYEEILSSFEGRLTLQESHKTRSLVELISQLLTTIFVLDDSDDFSRMANDPFTIPFRDIDPETCEYLLPIIEQIYIHINTMEMLGEERFINAKIFLCVHKASVYFASKQNGISVAFVSQAVEILETNKFQSFYTPHFVSICHLLFYIAVNTKDFALANRITGLQRKLASKLPVAMTTLTKEMDFLRSANLEIQHCHRISPNPNPGVCISNGPFFPETTSPSYTSPPQFANSPSPPPQNPTPTVNSFPPPDVKYFNNNNAFSTCSIENPNVVETDTKPMMGSLFPWEEQLGEPSSNFTGYPPKENSNTQHSILTASQENMLFSSEDSYLSSLLL